MSNIHDVPFPYHTRIKQFIYETGEVEMEMMNEEGQWLSYRIDEEQFRAGFNCPNDFLTEFDQDWDDYTDEMWVPTAEREYREMQGWIEEYPAWSPYWAEQLLQEADSSLIFEKFSKNNFSVSKNDTKKQSAIYKWRRYSSETEKTT